MFARNGSALDEIIAHEVGESIWKQTTPEFRSNWAEIVKKYEAVGGMAGESANEQFAIWFSRYWVGDDIPREIEIWVK